jgi:hypothetical protein
MNSVLSGIVDAITPEMPQHFNRWGGNMNQWQNNVQKIRDFMSDRIDFIPEGLNDCYTLNGPYDLTLNVQPANSGQIKLNSITIDNGDYPWTGSYHGGIDMLAVGIQSNSGYVFDHWEMVNQVLPNPNDIEILFELDQNDQLTAVFVPSGIGELVINEINYNSDSAFEAGDWIELYNNTNEVINLSNWVFKDSDDLHEYIIPNGTVMQPDSYLVFGSKFS